MASRTAWSAGRLSRARAISHEHLQRLVVALTVSEQLPPDLAAWLRRGATEYLRHGGRRPLCRCLGLRSPGRACAATLAAREARNEALRAAYGLLEGPPWSRVEVLALEIHHFQTRVWPRIRIRNTPLPTLSPLQQCLLDACHRGLRLPASARWLYRICTEFR